MGRDVLSGSKVRLDGRMPRSFPSPSGAESGQTSSRRAAEPRQRRLPQLANAMNQRDRLRMPLSQTISKAADLITWKTLSIEAHVRHPSAVRSSCVVR
jgi:hypothetical protein